jgi:hypothetical protein
MAFSWLITDVSPADDPEVDRTRWSFDADGFQKATNAALVAARRQLRDAMVAEHEAIVSLHAPTDFKPTLDGVPIDKSELYK